MILFNSKEYVIFARKYHAYLIFSVLAKFNHIACYYLAFNIDSC